jgi:hypothetical protein
VSDQVRQEIHWKVGEVDFSAHSENQAVSRVYVRESYCILVVTWDGGTRRLNLREVASPLPSEIVSDYYCRILRYFFGLEDTINTTRIG